MDLNSSSQSSSTSAASSPGVTPPPKPVPDSLPPQSTHSSITPQIDASQPAPPVQPLQHTSSPTQTPPNRKVKPRTRSSVVPRTKSRQPSFNSESLKPLNTHSPIAVAAAAAVTGDKIKRLLATQGPLPIRHITSHLASTIPGFGELSLSKQRRLIIAVLDGPKSEFVKVGWGRWAVGSIAGRKESLGAHAGAAARPSSVHRQSISHNLTTKPPLSPPLAAIDGSAVFSDSDDDSDSEVEHTDEEDWESIGPMRLRQTSPREQEAIAALVQLRSN